MICERAGKMPTLQPKKPCQKNAIIFLKKQRFPPHKRRREASSILPMSKARDMFSVAALHGACQQEEGQKKDSSKIKEEAEKRKDAVGKKEKPKDPNQPTISSFFGGKAARETPVDPVPKTCDAWDRTWGEGTEGLEIRQKRKHEDVVEEIDEDVVELSSLDGVRCEHEESGRGNCTAEGLSRGKSAKCDQEVTTKEDDGDDWVTIATSSVPKIVMEENVGGRELGARLALDSSIAHAEQWKEFSTHGGARRQGVSAFMVAASSDPLLFAKKSNGGRYSSLKTTDDKVYEDKIWRRDDGNKSPAGVKSSHSQAFMNGGSSDFGRKSADWKPAVHKEKSRRNFDAYEQESGTDREGVGSHLQRSEHQDGLPGGLPVGFEDKWNKKYVRMPCSPNNVTRDRISRWDMICSALTPRCGFHDVKSLIRTITSYTPCKTVDSKKWSFRALESLVNEWYDSKEKARFFQTILPFIIKSALMLPKHCPRPIRLLLAGKSDSVNLSSLQIVSLLANAFLCTFPEDKELLGRSFGRINFCMLFEAPQRDRHPNPVAQHIQKLLCILNYFERQAQRSEAELAHSCVSFHRRSHQQGRDWAHSSTCIVNAKLKVDSTGTIEDLDPTGATWEVDFANSIVGGGVLGSGCVQEEIRFLLSPELIASRLLTERLGDLEGVLITGSERFSKYTGYASSFKFHGDHVDPASKDTVDTTDNNTQFRRKTTITGMDAILFSNSEYTSQFRPKAVQRELNKAFVSFQARHALDDGTHVIGEKHAPWVATGNWGCGVFGGDLILKAVIQIMAAAEAGRNIHYLTFGNDLLAKQILQVYGVLCNGNNGRSLTVGQLWGALEKFRLSTERLAAPNGGQELLAFVLDLQWLKSGPADVIEVKETHEEREIDFHEKASEKQSGIEMRKGKKRESLSPQEVLDSEEEKT